MRKVFFFYYHKDKYYSSSPIVNNFKILHQWREKFFEFGIEMTSMLEFLPYSNKELLHNRLITFVKEKYDQTDRELVLSIINIIIRVLVSFCFFIALQI